MDGIRSRLLGDGSLQHGSVGRPNLSEALGMLLGRTDAATAPQGDASVVAAQHPTEVGAPIAADDAGPDLAAAIREQILGRATGTPDALALPAEQTAAPTAPTAPSAPAAAGVADDAAASGDDVARILDEARAAARAAVDTPAPVDRRAQMRELFSGGVLGHTAKTRVPTAADEALASIASEASGRVTQMRNALRALRENPRV